MKQLLYSMLAHPLTRNLSVDDPITTSLRKKIILEKPFLKKIYQEWYKLILLHLPEIKGPILELGSGAGFLSKYIPDLITSEVFVCSDVSTVLDARSLPFQDQSLRAIVMTDVLHHIPNPELFFAEAEKTLACSGRIIMIEPWVTPWSTFIYSNFHNEPFYPEADQWSFPPTGPLSGANGAIPWIVFSRDRERFDSDFCNLEVINVFPMMPFRYLLSGGVSLRSLMPGWSFNIWRNFERLLNPLINKIAMFALIVVEKQ